MTKTGIRKCLKGYLRIRISGYSAERFMNLCTHQKMNLWNLKVAGQSYEMNISVKDFLKMKPIIRKTKTKVKVLERHGFPFFLQKYRTRQFLIFGFFCSVMFLMIMTSYIWKIQVKGNVKCSDEEIKNLLDKYGVAEGVRKEEVSCEWIAELLREQFDDIIWVSASLDGIELTLNIKENMDRTYEDNSILLPADIIADKDGQITSIVTSKGKPLVKEGDMVKKGDVLVSGSVEIYNDAMEVTNYQYCEAEAEIYVQTDYFYENAMENTYEELVETGKKKYRFLIENDEKIQFSGRQKNGYKYYKITEEWKTFYLLGIISFPYKVRIEKIEECAKKSSKYEQDEIQIILSGKFERFCQDLEKKGVQILNNDVKIYNGVERTSAKGNMVLIEKIGQREAGKKYEIN